MDAGYCSVWTNYQVRVQGEYFSFNNSNAGSRAQPTAIKKDEVGTVAVAIDMFDHWVPSWYILDADTVSYQQD